MKEEAKSIQNEVRERTLGLILAAFGLVAGLAWNSAVTSLIQYLFPLSTGTIIAKFVYALMMTAVLAVLAYGLQKFQKNKQ
ncbi:MAG: hypothetical protein KGJ01_00185 [Patescibacteria group bacterium]|nr:hypothetical protein [Patescibacteria group bacterium]